MVEIYSPGEQRVRSRAIQDVEGDWIARQIRAGVDGPTPDDRPDRSDYNQHVPALEADGAELDRLFDRIDGALGGGSP